jgi:hypothetical protein
MPLHPNVRRCTHIHITGHRCGSPALKQEYFCYFHTRMIKGVQTRVDSQIHPIALIENPEAIQSAIMHMIDGVLKGAIDNKRAALVLKALYIAVRNSRNVYFRLRPDDMVREVPNYAQQYLSEHPELNPDSPPQAVAPQPVVATKKESHPERARPLRESKDPQSANSGNGAAGNSPRMSGGNRETIWGEDIPPLTNRQSQRWNEIKKLEASIEGAMHGDWRDLRTVFNAVGLTPGKRSTCHGVAFNRKGRNGASPGEEKA